MGGPGQAGYGRLYRTFAPGERAEPAGSNPRKVGGAFSSYLYPQTPEGLTLPEYDRPSLELAKKYKQSYSYFIHGKYLRDATESQLDATVQRICKMAADVRANLMVTIASMPPGASVEKANYVFKLVEKYGRY